MEQVNLPLSDPELRTVEEWAAEKHTEDHWLAAARYAFRWGLGRQVFEAIYDAAIAAVQTISLR